MGGGGTGVGKLRHGAGFHIGVTDRAGLRGTSLMVRTGLIFRRGSSCGEKWRRIHSSVSVNSLIWQI